MRRETIVKTYLNIEHVIIEFAKTINVMLERLLNTGNTCTINLEFNTTQMELKHQLLVPSTIS